MLEFLDAIVLIYTNTYGNSDICRVEIADTVQQILRTHPAVLDNAWTKCFSEAPALVLNLVRPESKTNKENYSMFRSWEWRTAKDTVIRECGACDTAVILSTQSVADASGHGVVEEDSDCPNHNICEGKLDREYPSC